MPSKDKRKLAAIMFADVVGYSRMMAVNEEQTLELLKDFENICSPIISDNTGEIIKKVGDELFCEFSSAKQAVDCALSIQEAIQPYNDSRPKDFKLQVRIGIHVGDIVLRDGDVFGDGVNVASRIQPFANPGGICISNAVKEAVSSHPNYNIKSEGQKELKNIIEKHTLYRVETGYEDEIVHVKKPTSSNKKIYIISALVLLLGIIGYYGFKYYKIYSDLTLLNNTIDIGEEYNVLLDKIFTGEKVLILGNFMKNIEPEKYKNINIKEVPDSKLKNIYDELISLISSELPSSVNLLSKYKLDKYFESKGELFPYYDTRIERQFALDFPAEYFQIESENPDSSTTYIMNESNANIGIFIFLFELDDPVNENKYFYFIVKKTINFESGALSVDLHHDLTSENRLVADIGSWIVHHGIDFTDKKGGIGEIIKVNQNKAVFKYYSECYDLIEENYILNVKRNYHGTEMKLNDLLEYKILLDEQDDTTSKWYKKFYESEFSNFSNAELERLRKDEHYLLKKGNKNFGNTVSIPIKLKVTEKYDSTGVAIIYEQENPFIKIKVGDVLYLK